MEKVQVVYREGGVFVLSKPAGIEVQQALTGRVVKGLCPSARLVHRIGMWTSGLIIFGQNQVVRRFFSTYWHNPGFVRKVYLAIVESPAWSEMVVDKPINSKSAETHFRVLERVEGHALVQCELTKNGRTHQIRRHLKSLGCPIVGDRKYKGPKTGARAGQLLHAWHLEVRLPVKRGGKTLPSQPVRFQAPIPPDFKSFAFNWYLWDSGASEVISVF